VLSAVSVLHPAALAGLLNNGPHGLSEILYAYVSTAGNNGSAFGRPYTNTNWYNLTLALNMLAGRFLMMVPMLALAGTWRKRRKRSTVIRDFPREYDPVHCAVGRGHPHRRCTDVLSRAQPRTDTRAPAAAYRKNFLKRRTEQRYGRKTKSLEPRDPPSIGAGFVRKLDPRLMVKNPVMLVVEIRQRAHERPADTRGPTHQGSFAFNLQITLWLWFTCCFANFAEAMAEGRGKAQADTLRKAKAKPRRFA